MVRTLSISISNRAARRYLAILASVTVLSLASAATFVFLADPFQVLRPSRGVPDLYSVAAYQVPGIARHYPYDAVVAGTSTSNNFRSSDLAGALGWQALNLSIAGSTVSEQRAVLEVAAATGKPRHVWWGIDAFAFRTQRGGDFPYYLYRPPGWRTAPYFLNVGALTHGLSTLARPPAQRTSLAQWLDRRPWDTQYTYGRAQTRTAWEHRHATNVVSLPATLAGAAQLVDAQIASFIAANPGIEFRIVLLPSSVLYQKFLLEERPDEFDAASWLGRAIVVRAATLPNVRVHDFRDAREITHDLDVFKDLLHFSGAVSRRIVREVAAGGRVVTPEAFDRTTALIRADAAAFR